MTKRLLLISLIFIFSFLQVNALTDAEKAEITAEQKKKEEQCANDKNCIDKDSFKIKVNDISPGIKTTGNEDKDILETSNFVLGTIIQKLMIALGSISVLIMIIGSGYIITAHGQDELLSKGKSIFISGITAMAVALLSYYLVSAIRFIAFN